MNRHHSAPARAVASLVCYLPPHKQISEPHKGAETVRKHLLRHNYTNTRGTVVCEFLLSTSRSKQSEMFWMRRTLRLNEERCLTGVGRRRMFLVIRSAQPPKILIYRTMALWALVFLSFGWFLSQIPDSAERLPDFVRVCFDCILFPSTFYNVWLEQCALPKVFQWFAGFPHVKKIRHVYTSFQTQWKTPQNRVLALRLGGKSNTLHVRDVATCWCAYCEWLRITHQQMTCKNGHVPVLNNINFANGFVSRVARPHWTLFFPIPFRLVL